MDAAFRLGSLFAAAGDLSAQHRSLGSAQPKDVDAEAVAEGIRKSCLGAVVGMLLPALAATVGGWIGAGEATAAVQVD